MTEGIPIKSGKVAITILVLYIGLFIATFNNQTLDSATEEEIKNGIRLEYARKYLPKIEDTSKISKTNTKARLGVQNIYKKMSPQNIDIISMDARGRGDDVVVKVELQIDGEDPPDKKKIRYFGMSYNPFSGWSYKCEVKKWQYYFASISSF